MLNSSVPEMPENTQPFDVIIVLGAAQKSDGSPGPAMIRRVGHGVQCLKNDMAPFVLMAGGCTKTNIPESYTMAQLAISYGVAEKYIHQENRSKRTLENAIECRTMMKENGWSRALLVTDRFHMPRALYTFQALGVDVTPKPNPVPISLISALSYCREWAARAVYHRIVRRHLAELL